MLHTIANEKISHLFQDVKKVHYWLMLSALIIGSSKAKGI